MAHLVRSPLLCLSFLLLLAGCASTTAAPPADTPCTDIGCENGLSVSFDAPDSLPPGHYTVDVEADGKRGSFEIDFPLLPCGAENPPKGELVFAVGVSGCALGPEAQTLVGLRLSERPETVKIRVVRSGSVLADVTLTPAYRELRPNGPSCEPTCIGASEAIHLNVP